MYVPFFDIDKISTLRYDTVSARASAFLSCLVYISRIFLRDRLIFKLSRKV